LLILALPMHSLPGAIVAALVGVAVTLTAALLALRATLYVQQVSHPLLRATAMAGVLLLGVLLLVASVYVSVQVALRLSKQGNPGTAK